MRTRSLRLRVIVGVLVALTIVLFAGGVFIERTLSAQLRGDLQQRLVDRVGYGQLLANQGLGDAAVADALRSTADGIYVEVRNASGTTVTGTSRPGGPAGPGGGPPPVPHAPASVVAAVDVSSDSRGVTATLSTSDGGTIVATGSTYDIAQTLQRLRTIELIAGLATLLVVALLLTGIVSVALRPLTRMTGLARGIARGGRGGRLRPDNPRTELGRTAEAFDEMLAVLEDAERDARAAAAHATAAEERMRRLLADVSHELRTPIAALQARAETMLRDDPERARREDLAVGMVRDTRRAARLVDDLLLMNRLEQSPGDQLRVRPVDLGALVRSVVDEQPVLEPGVRCASTVAEPVWVSGDPERLTQIVVNLVGNARRAVGGAGEVVAEVRADDRTAVVAITDSGPGVPPAERERVFDRFVRLDAARSRADGGSGLGLPISRALARAHGGDVVCADSDRGARFVVTLPLLPAPAPASASQGSPPRSDDPYPCTMDPVPRAGEPLQKLGFLTIGLFDPADPGPGHESTLQVIELGERLGFDSAWLRHRHLQHGISSPVAVLAAASQRTSRIELGTAVTPLGWENPLRLAEDLATVDLLSGGRLNPGVSVGPPMHWDDVRGALYPDTAEIEDFGYGRVERLLRAIRGDAVASFAGTEGIEVWSDRVQPHAAGLADRLWYGGASTRSATWAGEHGMHFLTSSVVRSVGGSTDFAAIQLEAIHAYRAANPTGRVSQGLVVIPTDSASSEQIARYEAYAAARLPRTTSPQGPGQLLFAPDIVGTSEQIAARLHAHAAFCEVDEVAFALPFSFEHDDYVQILTDMAGSLGPALGWTPAG